MRVTDNARLENRKSSSGRKIARMARILMKFGPKNRSDASCLTKETNEKFPKNSKNQRTKFRKFLNIDIEPAPPELELEVEMQCREIMKSNDLDNVKRYCTHMVRKKFDQDIFMASMLNRLIELEANAVVKELRKKKPINPIAKFFRTR